jgi:F-type H+-transporting ATPase subunit alpha
MMVVILYAITKGYMNDIPITMLNAYQQKMREYFPKKETKLLNDINRDGELTEEIIKELERALTVFNSHWAEEKG